MFRLKKNVHLWTWHFMSYSVNILYLFMCEQHYFAGGISAENLPCAIVKAPPPQKKRSIRFLVISQLQNRRGDTPFFKTFFNHFFFANQWNTCTWLLEPDQISHTQSMVAKRGHTNRASVHTPMWKSHLKHSMAEFQSIQQFWLQLDIVS